MAIRTLPLAALILLLATPAHAQNLIIIRDEGGRVKTTGDIGSAPDGSVKMRVLDNLGNVPPDGTECTLTERQKHLTVSATSKNGEVTFTGVIAGEYVLTVLGAPVSVVVPRQ